MNRSRALVLVVSLLCIAGLAVGAATVDVPRSGDPGVGNGTGNGSADEERTGESSQSGGRSGGVTIPPFVRTLAVAILFVSVLAALVVGSRQMGGEDAKLLVGLIIAALLIGIVTLGFVGQPSFPGQNTTQNESNDTNQGGGDSGRATEGDPKQSLDVPIALVGVFGLLVVALVGAIARFSGDDDTADVTLPSGPDGGGGDDGVTEVAEAAGRAADRLDAGGVDVDNAVFRAWREMTDALDVEDPATTTPAEFADAAVAAGMAGEDVRELTDLFEEVRYGDAAVTEAREQRATDALRGIESIYGGDDG